MSSVENKGRESSIFLLTSEGLGVCIVTKKDNWSFVCSMPEKCLDQVKLCVKSFSTWKYSSVLGGERVLSGDNICLLLY